jgi:hypothetical protein
MNLNYICSNAVLVILDFRSTPNVVHPMNIHVNINLHQQSGFGNKDNQASHGFHRRTSVNIENGKNIF